MSHIPQEQQPVASHESFTMTWTSVRSLAQGPLACCILGLSTEIQSQPLLLFEEDPPRLFQFSFSCLFPLLPSFVLLLL